MDSKGGGQKENNIPVWNSCVPTASAVGYAPQFEQEGSFSVTQPPHTPVRIPKSASGSSLVLWLQAELPFPAEKSVFQRSCLQASQIASLMSCY